jgi:hypothetical protein
MLGIGTNGGLIGPRRIPSTGSASGVWDPEEQKLAKGAGIWPSLDQYWENVELLLGFEGVNNSTSYTDLSNNNRTISSTSPGFISTDRAKFGSSSFYSSNGLGELSASGTAPFGTDDFTWECFWNPTELTIGYKSFFTVTNQNGTYGLYLFDDGLGRQFFFIRSTPGFDMILDGFQNMSTITLDTWHHVALVRQSGTIRVFYDGVFKQEALFTENLTGTIACCGSYSQPTSVLGYLDGLRMTSNVCRYPGTSSFTPPTFIPIS